MEQLEAQRAAIFTQRDHEAHPPMAFGVGVARQGADAGKGAGLVHAAVVAVQQVGVGSEQLEHLGEAAGGEVVAAADARALLEMDGVGEAVGGKHLVGDLERLLQADGSAQGPADLQEDLVGDVVVRGDEQLDEDLREGAGLAVNIDRLQALGHGSGRDLALDAAAGPLDERGDQLAGIFQAHRGVLGQADAAAALGAPRPELADRQRRDRGLRLGGDDRLALAHGGDRIEVHGERGVQRVIGLAGVLDARDAQVGGVVARVEHDAGDGLLADRGDQLLGERRQLLRDQKGIAASAHVQHSVVVQVEFRLEAVVAAQDFHRQPCGHELGDRGRDERLVHVLGDQLVALLVDHQHHP